MVDEAKTEILNTIIDQTKEVSEDPIESKDSTDGLRDTIKKFQPILDEFQPVLDEFEDLIKENHD